MRTSFDPMERTLWRILSNWQILALLVLLIVVEVWVSHTSAPSTRGRIRQRRAAAFPKLSRKLLYQIPEGKVFGRSGKRYVCEPVKEHDGGHVLVLGGSGSGKSSCFAIPTLLACFSQGREEPEETRTVVFAVDMKGELADKSTTLDDPKVKRLSFSDRTACGYDPLYGISRDSTAQELFLWFQGVAESLIPISADLKESFWKLSARSVFTGCAMYLYRLGTQDFIGITDEITRRPIRSLIGEILEDEASDGSIEQRCLAPFLEMADETLYGIGGELSQHLVIFNDASVRFQIRQNPRKADPRDLETGISIFLQVEEYDLDRMSDLMQMVLNQLIRELERRGEAAERPVLLLIDELARICARGKLGSLEGLLATGRSRKVSVCLITQSLAALRGAYTEAQITSMAENCRSKLILQASASQTQKEVIEWAGSYLEEQTTWGAGRERTTQTSYRETKRLRPEDLVTLPESGDCILIHNGYYRIRKTPYYKEKRFREAVERNQNRNKELRRRK